MTGSTRLTKQDLLAILFGIGLVGTAIICSGVVWDPFADCRDMLSNGVEGVGAVIGVARHIGKGDICGTLVGMRPNCQVVVPTDFIDQHEVHLIYMPREEDLRGDTPKIHDHHVVVGRKSDGFWSLYLTNYGYLRLCGAIIAVLLDLVFLMLAVLIFYLALFKQMPPSDGKADGA